MHELHFMWTHVSGTCFSCNYASPWRWPIWGQTYSRL